ncbi:MAG: TldD/PmbA family protein [Sulfolobales archaeon]|nr:TldD/PmbA family protein [Sulfolobales archaeon]MCX8208593.1 TldD/PmbA family protein [Sulfolobales archaeon]MDW8010363.1 TldD/PmbA family protein [Sulfolobales archaeon]
MSAVDLAGRVLYELRDRFDNVAVRVVSRDSVMLKIWNSQPGVLQMWKDIVTHLLLGKRRRVAVLEFRVSSPEEVVSAVKKIEDYVARVEESELYADLPEVKKPAPLQGGYDRRVVEYFSDPRPLAEVVVNSALSAGAERVAGTIELEEVEVALATSRGFSESYRKTEVMAYLRSFRGDLSGHWAWGSTAIDLKSLESVGSKSAEILSYAKTKSEFAPGRYDVILSPLVVGNLMNYVASMASGMAILIGMSFLAKKSIGDSIASESFTLVDAPRDALLPGSTPFDDEGVETYDKPIIDRGRLASVLHNTATGKVFKSSSTGNAGWVNPRPWNLIVKPGDSSLEGMISEVRRGYLITNNWYTRLQNYVEGQFSTVARDVVLEVRDGSIEGYVDRVRIADKFEALLKSARAMSRELYDIAWWEVRIPTRAPYILVESVNLTKPVV